MTAPNHITGGFVFTGLFCSLFSINIFSNPLYISLCLFGSLIPDIDHTKSLIGKLFYPIAKHLSVKFGHRTITHSIFFLLGIVFISICFDKFFFNNYNISIIVFFSVFSHLLLDMLTVQGIPLFYPIYKNPCVLPANPELRIRTGNLKQEGIILFIFSIMTIFMQDLFINGFWTTLNKTFGTITHIDKEAKTTNNFMEIDYNFYEFGENKKGTAYLISSSKNKITLFGNNEIFTIDKSNSNQKKIILDFRITDKLFKYKTVEINNRTESYLNQICSNQIIKANIKSNQKFNYKNNPKLINEIIIENDFDSNFSFISSDTLKRKLKKDLKIQKLKLKNIKKNNSKKLKILKDYKEKLKLIKKIKEKTTDLYLKNKYENQIIKLNDKIINYKLEAENINEIKTEIEFKEELIKEENIFYFNGFIKILDLPTKKTLSLK
jgi:inner membrane protein